MIRRTLVLACAFFLAGSVQGDLINEFQPNPVSNDPLNQSVELLGNPGDSFDVWLLSIEGERVTPSPGIVDEGVNLTGTYDANGLAVLSVSDFENPNNTLLLTDTFTGTVDSSDIDTDDDGVADDTSFWNTVLDAIGVTDNSGSTVNFLYGSQLGGADFAYTGDEPK